MAANRLFPHYLVQIIAHNGITQTCRNICWFRPLGLGCCNGVFYKNRTAVPQIQGRQGGQCQWPEFLKGNSHARRLFLNKGTGSRCADLIHLEIPDIPMIQGNIFGILSTDFKYRIHFLVNKCRGPCLGRDLVTDRLGLQTAPDLLPSGSGYPDSFDGQPFAQHLLQVIKPLFHSAGRIPSGTQVLRMDQPSPLVQHHQIGTGRADINAKKAAVRQKSFPLPGDGIHLPHPHCPVFDALFHGF